jgi:hypothetical protein
MPNGVLFRPNRAATVPTPGSFFPSIGSMPTTVAGMIVLLALMAVTGRGGASASVNDG